MTRLSADDVKAIRERFGLTQEEMANRLGIEGPYAKDTVRAWERGQRKVPGPASLALRLIVSLYDSGKTACQTVADGLWRGA